MYQTGSQERRSIGQPETTDGPTQTLERCRGLATLLCCAMAPIAEEPQAKCCSVLIKSCEQEGVDQAEHEHQVQTILPVPQARTFPGQFTLVVAPRHLD